MSHPEVPPPRSGTFALIFARVAPMRQRLQSRAYRGDRSSQPVVLRPLPFMAAVMALLAVTALTAGPAFAGRIVFGQPRMISNGSSGARALAVGDIDSDGDLDILTGLLHPSASAGLVVWLENDGHPEHPTFIRHDAAIGYLEKYAMDVVPEDVDGDGDLDFLLGTTGPTGGSLDWYESDGLSPPGFARRPLEPRLMRTHAFDAADLDGDGDIDIVSAHPWFDRITWHENDPLSSQRFSPHIVTDDPDGPWYPMTGFAHGVVDVVIADLDSDGDQDLISANHGNHTIAWFSSDGGAPPSFEPRLIATSALFAIDVIAVDLDGDGDLDVAAASEADDKIAWHENDGASVPGFMEHVIVEDPDGHSGPLNGFADNPISIHAADLDEDGDVDLLSSSSRNNLIAWYENDGASAPSFNPRIITSGIHHVGRVVTADLNGDGELDVLTTSTTVSSPQMGNVVWIEKRATLPHGKGGKHWMKLGKE